MPNAHVAPSDARDNNLLYLLSPFFRTVRFTQNSTKPTYVQSNHFDTEISQDISAIPMRCSYDAHQHDMPMWHPYDAHVTPFDVHVMIIIDSVNLLSPFFQVCQIHSKIYEVDICPEYTPLSILRSPRALIMVRPVRVYLKFQLPKTKIRSIFMWVFIKYSNAVILNPSFSLALSRFLLTITTP